MMPRNYPNLDTPLGRAWLAAASIQQNLLTKDVETNPFLVAQEVSRLAGAVKLLAEIIEAHFLNHGDTQ